jgi:hypothetical protein
MTEQNGRKTEKRNPQEQINRADLRRTTGEVRPEIEILATDTRGRGSVKWGNCPGGIRESDRVVRDHGRRLLGCDEMG